MEKQERGRGTEGKWKGVVSKGRGREMVREKGRRRELEGEGRGRGIWREKGKKKEMIIWCNL